MEWIKNQPVFFGQQDDCKKENRNFLQIVDNTDKTQFQLTCEPCISAQQLIPSPDFSNIDGWGWAPGSGGWVNAGSLCGGSASGIAIANYYFESGYYKIILTIESISPLTTLNVNFDSALVAQIKTVGTFEIFAFSGNGDRQLSLSISGSGTVCLSYTAAYEVLTNLIVPIYDKNGLFKTSISYNTTPDYFVFSQNSVTVTIDWGELGLSNDCFYMCLLDPCVNHLGQNYPANIRDGGFDSPLANNWNAEGGASQVGSTVTFSGASSINQTNVFNSFNATISIVVNVTAISGNLFVKYGDNTISTISTIGNHTISGIPSSNFSLKLYMSSGSCTISGIQPVVIASSDYVCDSTSKLMRLGDYTNDCTLLINMCNNENGLGFIFENSGFTPRIRLKAKLKKPTWKTERSIFDDSRGKRFNYYGSNRKQFILAIDLQPEYIHDFLAQGLIVDNFYINNIPYHIDDDEYNIEYSDIYDFIGQVKITVGEQIQNIKNTNCSANENYCTLPPNYELLADGSGYAVQADGSKIIING